jgi:hypothetical protein
VTLFGPDPTAPTGCPHGTCSHALALHNEAGRCEYADCPCGLRNPTRSAEERDRGMAIAASAKFATPEWKALAMQAIRQVAEKHETLGSIDAVELLTKWGEAPPYGSRVMGPLMRAAAKEGIIEGPIHTRQSDLTSSHRGIVNVWRSLICKEPS